MDTRSQYHFDLPEEDRAFLVLELASLYLLNLLMVADKTDEGGLDHPLPASHQCLQPAITTLLDKQLIDVEDYADGREYVPTSKADQVIRDVIATTETYQNQTLHGLENIKKAFFLAMDQGKLNHIEESTRPWYESIMRFDFYEALAPNPLEQQSRSTPPNISSEDSAIRIHKKPEHFETKSYIYKKPTLLGLVITIVFILLAEMLSFSLLYIVVLLGALWCAYYASMKTSVGSEGLFHKTILDQKTLPIEAIQELVLKEEDGKAISLEVIGNQGTSITISPWIDDFNGIKRYLETIKDEQIKNS